MNRLKPQKNFFSVSSVVKKELGNGVISPYHIFIIYIRLQGMKQVISSQISLIWLNSSGAYCISSMRMGGLYTAKRHILELIS